MNFSEIAEVLHISREGSRKRILKYQDAEELQEYLIRDENGKVIGLEEAGIEILRNLGASRRSFAEERNLNQYKHQIELLSLENASLKERLQDKDRELDRFMEIHKSNLDRIQQLEAELKAFKGMSFWQRLTYKG